MRTMEPPQPTETAGRLLFQCRAKNPAADALRDRLMEAGRNPLLIPPPGLLANQFFQIPTPLGDFVCGGKNPDEPERVDLPEGQPLQRSRRQTERVGGGGRIDHLAAADSFSFHPNGNGIPVD
jgi:hypothetical protein